MVYVRYQDPETGQVNEIKQTFARSQFASSFEATSPRFQLAAAVAEYAEILRQSYWAKGSSLENVQGLAQRVQAGSAERRRRGRVCPVGQPRQPARPGIRTLDFGSHQHHRRLPKSIDDRIWQALYL